MKLSLSQRRMLVSIRDHGDPCAHLRGRSAFGGATATIWALERRKLVEVDKATWVWTLTPTGREVLAATLKGAKRV